MTTDPVRITVYRRAGARGPFRVTIPRGECALTGDVIRDTPEQELDGGADELSSRLERPVEPNPERGQCSLSPASRPAS